MADIPTIPGTAQVSTPTANVHADFDSLNAGYRGARAAALELGEAGQQIGEIGMSFAQKMQKAKNFSTAADFDRTLREQAAAFHESRIGRSDEDDWQAQWQETADQTYNEFVANNPVRDPTLKRQLSENYKDWKSANGIEVDTMANHQRISRYMDNVRLDADAAAQSGDMEHAEEHIGALYDGAVQNHIMLPEVAQEQKKTYLAKTAEYGIRNMMMSAPWMAPGYLQQKDDSGKYTNLKSLNPQQREELTNTAKIQFTKFQSDSYQGLIQDMQDTGKPATPEILSDLVTKKVITPRMRQSYENAYRKGNFNTDPVETGQVFSDITNYDPQSDPKNIQRSVLLGRVATLGFPQNVQSEMNRLMGEKTKVDGPLNTPVAKDAFQAIDQRFKLGLYGKYEERFLNPASQQWETLVHPEVYEQAMKTKSRIEDATRKFLKQKPEATADEVNGFVSNMQMSAVTANGRGPLLQTLGVGLPRLNESAAQKKARLDAILGKDK